MAANVSEDLNKQSTTDYLQKKHINELFEVRFTPEKSDLIYFFFPQAMMTALMVYKPDDHISFLRKCLDKVS